MNFDRWPLYTIFILYCAYTIIRRHGKRTGKAAPHPKRLQHLAPAQRRDWLELLALTLAELILLILLVLEHPLMVATMASWPLALRWTGLVPAITGLVLHGFASHHLGRQYSPIVESRPDAVLVQVGPYAKIRHPIYTALILFNLGIALLSGNVLVAIFWPLGLGLLLIRRIPREEASMASRFGEAWLHHCRRTGLLWPRWHSKP